MYKRELSVIERKNVRRLQLRSLFLYHAFPSQYHIPVIRLYRLPAVSLEILTLHWNVTHSIVTKTGSQVQEEIRRDLRVCVLRCL